eukprot:PITA_36428
MIEKEVDIEQPKGFETFNKESHVCRLKQVLYGLKQAPRAWYTRIDSYFTRLGFTKSEVDANIYHIVVEVWKRDEELFVSQGKYANEILNKFHMERSKLMETPLVVNQLSQAMVKPTKLYWKVVKHVLRYLRGTTQFGLWYRKIEEVKLQGFTEAYSAGSPSHQKSTSGGIFSIGSMKFSWYNMKQILVALNSA